MEDYFAFQPKFGTHNDDDTKLQDDLPTPAAHEGYLSPFDSPSPSYYPDPETPKVRQGSTSTSKPRRTSRSGSVEVEGKAIKEKKKETGTTITGTLLEGDETTTTRKKPVLSPSELVTVLDQDGSPPPPPVSRFLHGGPRLSDLEAPSVVMPNSEKGKDKPVANSEWRAFTDEEEKRLQEGFDRVREQTEKGKQAKEAASKKDESSKDKSKVVDEEADSSSFHEAPTTDPESTDPPHLVPVGLDNLFTVDLIASILFPAFWTGSPVRMIRSHWFYAPASISPESAALHSHQLKPYPVDPSLSSALDRAYSQIRPWDTSYESELKSALKGGSDAQKRLCVPLGLENESGADASADLGIEVIFEAGDRGRVYSKGMIGSVAKSFWSSGKGLGGGQVVLRGWDAFRQYVTEQAEKKKKPTKTKVAAVATSDHTASESENEASSSRSPSKNRSRPRTGSSSSQNRPAEPPAPSSGFFSSLRNRFVGTAASTDGHSSDGEAEGRSSIDKETPVTDTQEALEGPRKEDAVPPSREGLRTTIGEVDELVLVIHGVGQQLAQRYESFNFTLAVNQFRSACTQLSTSTELSPLLHGKRAQFIPVMWRTDLDFDAVDDSADVAEENLGNRFSINDIQIPNSVPFLRTIVSGLVLDVPFYLSPAHKEKMVNAVVREANRIYRLFCKRNPNFCGKVSIIAHSLGSCIAADILSNQPTFAAEAAERDPAVRKAQDKDQAFCFDTRVLILVGSPLAFFLHLGKGQLIARAGRERTKNVDKDVALDRAGRYGCLAVDAVYNCYHASDPVAFALNPCVDVRYSKLIKPVPIPSSNQTLLQNLSSAYYRVSKIFDMSSLWGGTATTAAAKDKTKQTGEQAKEQAEEQKKEVNNRVGDLIKEEVSKQSSTTTTSRPRTKRLPSEMPKFQMGKNEFEWIGRAERRMKALNPSGTVDYYLPAEGINQYIDALTAHQDYWEDRRFSTFVLTQLFSSQEELEKAVRDEIGEEEE